MKYDIGFEEALSRTLGRLGRLASVDVGIDEAADADNDYAIPYSQFFPQVARSLLECKHIDTTWYHDYFFL